MKEENEEKTQQETEHKTSSKIDKELYWVFGVMVAAIAVFLIVFTLAKGSNSFNYNGLSFQKEMLGNIPLYKYSYTTGKVTRADAQAIRTKDPSSVVVLLRNDPRKLEDISVEGKIEYLPLEQYIYVTVDSSPKLLCEYSTVALAELSSFWSQNGFVAKAGISDEAAAKEQKLDYITCENHPDRMVVSFKPGDSPSVVREGNCYTITVADCNILAPTEKFIVQSIIDAKNETSS